MASQDITKRQRNLTIVVEAPVLDALKAQAAANDRTLSAEVRRILRDHVESAGRAA